MTVLTMSNNCSVQCSRSDLKHDDSAVLHSELLEHNYYNREPALQMKAVIRNLAFNPYGAPTVFMTGGWMNLKRVCHRREPISRAEISSRTAGLSCNLNKTRSAGFKGFIAISMRTAAKNPMIAILVTTFLFWEAYEQPQKSKSLSRFQQEWTTVNDFSPITHVRMEKCIWLTRSRSCIVFKHSISWISMTSLLCNHHAFSTFLLLQENKFHMRHF